MVGKYDRELIYTLNPARAKSCTVAFSNEPLGMPSLSFIKALTEDAKVAENAEGAALRRYPAPSASSASSVSARKKQVR